MCVRLIYESNWGGIGGWDYLVLYGFGVWGGGITWAVNVVTSRRLGERLVLEMFSFYRYQVSVGQVFR